MKSSLITHTKQDMTIWFGDLIFFFFSSLCLRYTTQTGASQGSADLLSLYQDRPHPAEGVLWLHMLHHVAWRQNRGPLSRAVTGATNQHAHSTGVYISNFSLSVWERLWGMDGALQMQVENFPQGKQGMLQSLCGVLLMLRPKFVLCWIFCVPFIFNFFLVPSLLSTSLIPLLFFKSLLSLIISAQAASFD